jgi:uncharacterized protein (DUF433 family)
MPFWPKLQSNDWLPQPNGIRHRNFECEYLVNLPNVRGGNAIVDGTRIGVHDVVGLIVNGSTVDDVVRSFPVLTRAQVYECLAHYEDHRTEIDTLVARQMSSEL